MAARITACCLQKGGTGKSSTSHALSAGLMSRGYRVLTVDADAQCNLSHTMRANMNGKSLFEAFSGEPINDVIQKTPQGDIVASSSRLVGADKLFMELNSEPLGNLGLD